MDAEAERQKAERGISLNMGGSKGKVADVFAESKAEAEGKAEKHKPLTRSERLAQRKERRSTALWECLLVVWRVSGASGEGKRAHGLLDVGSRQARGVHIRSDHGGRGEEEADGGHQGPHRPDPVRRDSALPLGQKFGNIFGIFTYFHIILHTRINHEKSGVRSAVPGASLLLESSLSEQTTRLIEGAYSTGTFD